MRDTRRWGKIPECAGFVRGGTAESDFVMLGSSWVGVGVWRLGL